MKTSGRFLRKSFVTRGYDATSAVLSRRRSLRDQEQLRIAVAEKRTFVTHNIRDFVRLHHSFDQQHYGILVSNQEPIHILLRRLLYFMSQETSVSVQRHLFWLSDYEPQRR